MLHTFSQMHEETKPPETTAQGESGQPGPPHPNLETTCPGVPDPALAMALVSHDARRPRPLGHAVGSADRSPQGWGAATWPSSRVHQVHRLYSGHARDAGCASQEARRQEPSAGTRLDLRLLTRGPAPATPGSAPSGAG